MSLELSPIFEAVRQAAHLCYEVQQRHIVRSDKAGSEPVTIADYGSQAIICRALWEHYPDDGVMSEEWGDQFMTLVEPEQRQEITNLVGEILGISITEDNLRSWLDHGANKETPRMWIVDPIDGTKGFLAQRHFVNAVGILQDRQPVAGVLGAPAYPGGPKLLYAIDGTAFMQPLDGSAPPQTIQVSERSDPVTLKALESVEKSHVGHGRLARVRELMGMDGATVERADSQEKYGRVAAGDADFYLRLPRHGNTRPHSIWDHAPGAALVQAAGGRVTDVDGSPLDFSEGTSLKNYGVIATNGRFHDLAVEAVQTLLAEEDENQKD
jgi:HAL2 family 3'(2'),5'-bisphosphate nucleotidase